MIMKKYLLLFFLTFSTLLVGCGDDELKENEDIEDIEEEDDEIDDE